MKRGLQSDQVRALRVLSDRTSPDGEFLSLPLMFDRRMPALERRGLVESERHAQFRGVKLWRPTLVGVEVLGQLEVPRGRVR